MTTDPRDRYWPLLVLALFAVPAAIVALMAPSAAADPGAPADVDEVFLEALRIYGITGESDAGLIDAGHAVCDLYAEGTSGSDAVAAVNAANPTLTVAGSDYFTSISLGAYCPEYLLIGAPA